MSLSAVTNVSTELLRDGLIDEISGDRDRSPRVGRPSTLLRIRPDGRFVVGVRIEVGMVDIALCDALANVRERRRMPFEVPCQPQGVLGLIVDGVRSLLDQHPDTPVIAVGVAVPGPVDRARRVHLLSPNLGWSAVAVADTLEAALGIPAVIDQSAGAMARAESRFGAHKDVDSMAFIWIGTGVGAGLILDGRPYRGGTHGVTELGHLPSVPGGPRCVCGNVGCLETVASVPALEQAVRTAAATSPRLRSGLRRGGPVDALVAAARDDDATALAIVEAFVEHIAAASASLVNLLNPRLIVVGGLLATAEDVFVDRLVRALRAHVFPLLRNDVRVVASSLGADCGVAGAAAIALDRYLYELLPRAMAVPVDPGRRPGL